MVRVILIIVLIIFGATFCTLNRQEITLRYFFGGHTDPFPLFLLVLTALIAGMGVGFSMGWGERRKLRVQARDLGERVKKLQEGIEQPPKAENPDPSTGASESPENPLS